MLNTPRRKNMATPTTNASKRPDSKGKKYNTKSSYGDKDGMERAADNTVAKNPEWQDPGRVLSWGK